MGRALVTIQAKYGEGDIRIGMVDYKRVSYPPTKHMIDEMIDNYEEAMNCCNSVIVNWLPIAEEEE